MSLTLALRHERTWHRASAPLMGTVAELVVDGGPTHIAKGFRRLRSLEASWSRFRADSELNRLHEHPGHWTRVSPDLLLALSWCRRMHDETSGIFDPTIRRSLEALGYDRSFAALTDSDADAPPTSVAPGLSGLHIDASAHRARLEPGLSIDLGGIGKGLAADVVARELHAAGARTAYVSLGGDIHTCGEPPDEGGWPVPLLHPVTGAVIALHPLMEGGLVMSTVALRQWRRGAQLVHHIIDPRTGRSTDTDVIAVAVAARSAARAEALAKSAIVLGARDGGALLRRADVVAWIVTAGGVVKIEEQPWSH